MMDHLENIQITLAAGESAHPASHSEAHAGELRTCPDCGTPGKGTYCSVCGEVLEPKLPPVHHYLKEFIHDLLALDSKLARTIPALLFRPGFLTQEYIAGRRERYLIPSRLYLLTAFLVFFALGSFLHTQLESITGGKSEHVGIEFGTLKGEAAKASSERLVSLAITVSPYVILLGSTPMFALILMILYRKKKRLFVEHLVFSFHFFAFALLVLVAGIVINSIYAAGAGFLLFFVYLYMALRRVYHDRGVGLFMRFSVSSAAYFGIAIAAILVSILAGYGLGVYSGDLPDLRKSTGGFPGPVLKDTSYTTP